MMKFRKGDVVSVRGVVEYDFNSTDEPTYLFLKIPGIVGTTGIDADKVEDSGAKLEEAKFEIGDCVAWPGGGEGMILAIRNGHAWIDLGGGGYCTRVLSSVERVDPEGEENALAD